MVMHDVCVFQLASVVVNAFPSFALRSMNSPHLVSKCCWCILIYIYICMYIYISGERVWSPQCFCWLECAQCVYSWTLMVSGDLWNVHNFCDTCTISLKRAQHLWHVHNISETYTYNTPKLILYKMPMLWLYKMLFRDPFYRGLAWPSIKCPSRAPYFIIL